MRADMHEMLGEQRAQTRLIASIERRVERFREGIAEARSMLESHPN